MGSGGGENLSVGGRPCKCGTLIVVAIKPRSWATRRRERRSRRDRWDVPSPPRPARSGSRSELRPRLRARGASALAVALRAAKTPAARACRGDRACVRPRRPGHLKISSYAPRPLSHHSASRHNLISLRHTHVTGPRTDGMQHLQPAASKALAARRALSTAHDRTHAGTHMSHRVRATSKLHAYGASRTRRPPTPPPPSTHPSASLQLHEHAPRASRCPPPDCSALQEYFSVRASAELMIVRHTDSCRLDSPPPRRLRCCAASTHPIARPSTLAESAASA